MHVQLLIIFIVPLLQNLEILSNPIDISSVDYRGKPQNSKINLIKINL
jgi:hypothetical protein